MIKTSEGDKYRISSIRRCGYYLFWCLFCVANIYFAACWLLLFEGSVYFFQELRIARPLSRAATIRGRRLFEEILYVVKVDLQISWFCCKCFFYKPRLRDYPLCVLPQEHITACEVTLLVHQRISWCQHAFDQWLPPHSYWKPFFLNILSQGQGLVVSCPDPTRKVW